MGTPEICRPSSQAAQISDVLSALSLTALGNPALLTQTFGWAGRVN